MERFQRYAKPLLAVALVVILLLGGTAVAQSRRIEQLSNELSANYERAVYEGAELMRGVETNLRKLTVSASGAQLQGYFNEISRQAQGAESAVTSLPFFGEAVQSATKAINQMGDFSATLSDRLARGGAITEDDMKNIDQLISAAVAINTGLGRMINKLEEGQGINGMEFEAIPVAESTTGEAGEYPTLIYDGPFSDASERTHFRALTGGDVTAEQALQHLISYMGEERIDEARHDGESEIPVPVYEFTIRSGDVQMSAAVTKQEGQVLYVLPGSQISSAGTAVETCIANAKEFLSRNGYDDMMVSYYYQYQNVLTINFAATQDGVLLYPDLVKVQISMQDGAVIGVECANYLKNHTRRTLSEPQITQEEALARVNGALETQFARLALIPVGTREKFTYEISAKDAYENQYLIYIDAVTGQEQQIYQLISDENGTLAE